MEIAELKEQINLLQQNEKDYQDLNFLFTNLEHRYNLLFEEKQRIEMEYNRRHEFNMEAVAMHRAEIDKLRADLQHHQIESIQYKEQFDYLAYENQQLTDEVNNLRQAYTKIVEQIQEQDDQYSAKLHNNQQYIDNLTYQIKQFHELKNNQERKQLGDIEVKHQQSWKVDKYISEIESYKSQNEKLNVENKQSQKQVERLEQQINNYKEQMNLMTAEIGKLQHTMSSLTKELKDQQKQRSNTKELKNEIEVKNLKTMNQNLQQKCGHLESQIEILTANNQQLSIDCECMRNKLYEIENNKNLVQNQYAKSLNKMQEERKIIKDYLRIYYIKQQQRDRKFRERIDCIMKMTFLNVQKRLRESTEIHDNYYFKMTTLKEQLDRWQSILRRFEINQSSLSRQATDVSYLIKQEDPDDLVIKKMSLKKLVNQQAFEYKSKSQNRPSIYKSKRQSNYFGFESMLQIQ